MAWYLGITTTRKIIPMPGMDKERGEFAVERQLQSMGVDAFVPKFIEFKRQGKRRYADAIPTPYLPGYIFADLSPEQFYKALEVRGMARTLMALTAHDLNGTPPKEDERGKPKPGTEKVGVLRFREIAAQKEAEGRRIIESNDRAEMVQYNPGDVLDIISGPFLERAVRFIRTIDSAHSPFPMIEGETELFGRTTKIQIDPLDVKVRAG